VVVVGLAATALVRRRTHDDVHSVEHYHRSLHTLEEIRTHTPAAMNGDSSAAEPANALKSERAGSTTVRLTEPGHQVGPPPPPPPVPIGAEPLRFDDAATTDEESESASSATTDTSDTSAGSATTAESSASAASVESPLSAASNGTPTSAASNGTPVSAASNGSAAAAISVGSIGAANSEHPPSTFMSGSEDPAMHGIDKRPRRVAAPAAAIAVVGVLIVILIVTGFHSTSTHHEKGSSTAHSVGSTATAPGQRTIPAHRHPAATTTVPTPTVSAPSAVTAHSATYTVGPTTYTLNLSAVNGECWLEATNTANGSVLFSGTLLSGQSHSVSATGGVTVVAGAPQSFSATVNGAPVALPSGYQAPFTLTFQNPPVAF
jgi:RodZ C-terminal domain